MLSYVSSFNLQLSRRSFLGASILNQNIIVYNNHLKLHELTFNITKIKELIHDNNKPISRRKFIILPSYEPAKNFETHSILAKV